MQSAASHTLTALVDGTRHQVMPEQRALIASAPLFFVASADPAMGPGPHGIGPINLSPKGGVPLHVSSPTRVAYEESPPCGSGPRTAGRRHPAAPRLF